MVVQCPSCKTKFRIADEKVTERGVRVRCTACKSVFQVKKSGAELAASSQKTGTTQELQALAPNDPGLHRATADDLFGMDELTGERKALPGSVLSSDPDLRAPPRPSTPPPARANSLPPPPPSEAMPPPPPDETPSEPVAPLAGLALPLPHGVMPDAEPAPAAVKLAAIKTTKREAFDGLPLEEAREPAAAPKELAAERATTGEMAALKSGRRELVAVLLTGLIGALLALGASAIFASEAGRLSLLRAASNEPLVATTLARGLYDTVGEKPIYFVRGTVENRSDQPQGPVNLVVELVSSEGLQLRAEAVAGSLPSAAQVRALRSTDDAAALVRQLAQDAAGRKIAPGESAPFFALIADPPPGAERDELRLRLAVDGR